MMVTTLSNSFYNLDKLLQSQLTHSNTDIANMLQQRHSQFQTINTSQVVFIVQVHAIENQMERKF